MKNFLVLVAMALGTFIASADLSMALVCCMGPAVTSGQSNCTCNSGQIDEELGASAILAGQPNKMNAMTDHYQDADDDVLCQGKAESATGQLCFSDYTNGETIFRTCPWNIATLRVLCIDES